jgi:hypothetical protein
VGKALGNRTPARMSHEAKKILYFREIRCGYVSCTIEFYQKIQIINELLIFHNNTVLLNIFYNHKPVLFCYELFHK